MKKGNKNGLSPVIASVLLIMLVLVLASLIFLWARGFIGEQIEKFEGPIEDTCNSVDFSVRKVSDTELEIQNAGNIDIFKFDIKMSDDKGNSEMKTFDISVDAGKSVRAKITLLMNGVESPETIVVYPALLGTVKGENSNQAFTCMDMGFTLI